jgi:hypothetical protein
MLMFNENHANKYGLKEAIVLHKIIFYILLNKKNGKNLRLGKYWTFQSKQGWRESLKVFSDMQIWRSLKSLERQGALVSGSFNKMAYDKTRWYALSKDVMDESLKDSYWKKVHFKNATTHNKTEITHNKTATPIQLGEELLEDQPY